MLLRAAAQAGIVILLARALGASAYGQFVAVLAVASFCSPFAGLGLSHMVLRNGARNGAFLPAYFARAAHWWLLTAIPAAVAAMLLAWLLLPAGTLVAGALLAIAADVTAVSLTDLHARRRQAMQRMHAMGATNAGLPLLRLSALVALLLTQPTADTTAVFWVFAAASTAYALLLWAFSPPPRQDPSHALPEPLGPRQGLPFSLSALAVRIQLEFNKPVLAQVGFGLAGSFNVAQRIIDLAGLPLNALQEALWPRLYAQGNPGRQLRRTGAALLALAVAVAAGIWLAAPVLPWLLGPSFESAVGVARLLALLPTLQMFRLLVNFRVIHHGWMELIGWAYLIGALCSVGAVAILVPRHGLHGAVAAGYLAEVAMTVALLTGMAWRRRRQATAETPP